MELTFRGSIWQSVNRWDPARFSWMAMEVVVVICNTEERRVPIFLNQTPAHMASLELRHF